MAAALKAATSAAAFPVFEAWLQGAVPSDPAELVFGAVQLNEISGASDPLVAPLSVALRGYRATQLAGRVVYRSTAKPGGKPAFIDLGNKILVHAVDDRDAVRASLLLIASRYPDNKIAVTGDRAFQRLVLKIANEERIQLDGALGRRQVRHMTEARPQPLAPVTSTDHVAATKTAAPRRTAPAPRARPQHRVLTMLGRIFHDDAWLASDFWDAGDGRGLPTRIPTRPHSLDDSPSRSSVTSPPYQPSPAELAHRAAAIAAAARGR